MVVPGEKVRLWVERKSDLEKVWYEWQVRVGEECESDVHNVEGRSYAIKKL